ncbi:unnamed protein product [Sphagnum balticum]
MPPHKYYCDYCDKQFYDTPASRKRHLKGISHQRAKKQWFDSFKGSYALFSLFGPPDLHCSPILPQQLVHFTNRLFGVCRFRNHCNSFHPNWPLPVQFGVSTGNFSRPELAVASVLERNLPPSLCPPPEGGYHPPPWIDWG